MINPHTLLKSYIFALGTSGVFRPEILAVHLYFLKGLYLSDLQLCFLEDGKDGFAITRGLAKPY